MTSLIRLEPSAIKRRDGLGARPDKTSSPSTALAFGSVLGVDLVSSFSFKG
jgi:hypothetical protein